MFSSRAATAGAVVLALLLGGTACGSAPEQIDPSGVDELEVPTPDPDPDDFVAGVDNRWFPLPPGARWRYALTQEGERGTVVMTVLPGTREVAGIAATVVERRTTAEDGSVLEEASAFYAQDRDGNVWHLGDETTYVAGGPDGRGSWEAGAGGAEAGLAMPAVPRVGDGYAVEDAPGRAQDRAEVLSVDGTATVGGRRYRQVVRLEVTSPLEPGAEEQYYAPGVGLVLADAPGSGRRLELVQVEGQRSG
jgi:hypothetical protein